MIRFKIWIFKTFTLKVITKYCTEINLSVKIRLVKNLFKLLKGKVGLKECKDIVDMYIYIK